MKRIVFYSKKSVCIGLAAVALQASAADNERATCSDLSLGTSEKFAEANGLLIAAEFMTLMKLWLFRSLRRISVFVNSLSVALPLVLIRCSD